MGDVATTAPTMFDLYTARKPIEETITEATIYRPMPDPDWGQIRQVKRSSGFAYLAGPYNALPDLQLHDGDRYCKVDANINEARRWAVRLALDGIPFFCSALNSAHFDTIAPAIAQEFWCQAGLEILKYARALFLLPDWRLSKGAQAEKTFAQTNDIPIYTHNMYEEFLRFWKT